MTESLVFVALFLSPFFPQTYKRYFQVNNTVKTCPELFFFSAADPVGWSSDYHAQD